MHGVKAPQPSFPKCYDFGLFMQYRMLVVMQYTNRNALFLFVLQLKPGCIIKVSSFLWVLSESLNLVQVYLILYQCTFKGVIFQHPKTNQLVYVLSSFLFKIVHHNIWNEMIHFEENRIDGSSGTPSSAWTVPIAATELPEIVSDTAVDVGVGCCWNSDSSAKNCSVGFSSLAERETVTPPWVAYKLKQSPAKQQCLLLIVYNHVWMLWSTRCLFASVE